MNLFPWWCSSTFILSFTLLLVTIQGTTFTFVNRCNYTVWPAIFVVSGEPELNSTGFELPKESSWSSQFLSSWSGRIWARTGCNLDQSGLWSCQTGDCGTGLIECNNTLYTPPATIAEFTLGSFGGDDFYDVSIVDGFNIPMNLEAVGGSGSCESTGCDVDINRLCPVELALKHGQGCLNPCNALGNSEYCCIGAYNLPDTCGPNVYSEMFKAACPRSYSYAYDDSRTTFSCAGADYVVTFCPSSSFSS